MILQTLFLLKRYGNSTIFTRDIYNANNAYRTSYASSIRIFYSIVNVTDDAIRYALEAGLIEDFLLRLSNIEKKKKKNTKQILLINFIFVHCNGAPVSILHKMMTINYNVILHSQEYILDIFISNILFSSIFSSKK